MARYTPMYEIEIRHSGLNAYRHIRGRDKWVVEQKADAQLAKWNEQWQRKKQIEKNRQAREAAAAAKDQKKAEAETLTQEAQNELAALENILATTLGVDDKIEWESLKDDSSFGEIKPRALASPPSPQEPDPKDYAPKIGLLGFLIPPIKKNRTQAAEGALEVARDRWAKKVREREALIRERKADHSSRVEDWEARKRAFEYDQKARNSAVDDLASRFENSDPTAIEEYVDLVLSRSSYPDWVQRDWELEFQPETKILIINLNLPLPDELPTLREVKYVATRDAFDEKHITAAQQKKSYDLVIYQICLRTIHEVFESDREQNNIEAVTFNGITSFTDPATGQPTTNCICTIQTNREEFEAINLANVEPKACFKALKGIAASQLQNLAPVAPLMSLKRDDARFIPGADVTSKLQEGENIAAMDWQEFEHLIRQVFESEFSGEGSEVKVTQGSRDGGVDAIAFDPDPIRGGKIVIQAKRYTNTVGVEAVRDLYGTVVNEGATKGILVTTSQYGPDARKFAADKPLALIDGSNLLYLLGKLGVKARIDIAEAKQQFRDAAG
ncbi:restriction endonuclease [Hyphobacterium sp.]|uniref:restriction endonuclease n=1 Tax=Hyphobacterium sp. TaxID=2004662 RepID=UPI003BAA5CB0